MTHHPSAGRSSCRSDRWFAAIVTLSINGLVIWFLDRGMSPPGDVPSTPDAAIELTWVLRPSDQLPETKPIPAAIVHPTHDASSIASRVARGQKQAMNVVVIPAVGTPQQASTDDHWTPDASLDLRLPDTPPTFQRDLLAPRIQPVRATPDRMRLAFRDRSIGGTLQRLAKNSVCGELHKQLLAAQGGIEAVVNDLQEHGCIR